MNKEIKQGIIGKVPTPPKTNRGQKKKSKGIKNLILEAKLKEEARKKKLAGKRNVK